MVKVKTVDISNIGILVPEDTEHLDLEPELGKNSIKCSFEVDSISENEEDVIFVTCDDEININVVDINEYDGYYNITVEVNVLEGSENVIAGFIVSNVDDFEKIMKSIASFYSLKVVFDTRDVVDRL